MQFHIYSNQGPSAKNTPLLLDLQAPVLSDLSSRLVVPLRKKSSYSEPCIGMIHIPLIVNGEEYIAFVSEMAAVSKTYLGKLKGNVEELRTQFISAVDLLITGF
jgi:toxin CcdB